MQQCFKIFLFTAITALMLGGCKKDENMVYFEGGTNPVLTASSTSALVLQESNKDNFAVKFSWTNPNYRFSTGISSQNVNYFLQVDTTGANFTSPNMQQVSIANDLEMSFTVKELNAILTRLELAENMPHQVEFRMMSTINGSVPLYSNVIKMTITPYLDVAVPLPPTDELYATGSALPSDWTNSPPATQKATPDPTSLTSTGRPTAYFITLDFVPGKQYKFLSNLGAWQPQYGGSSATGGDLGFNMGLPGQSDPDAIPTPNDAGTYKVTLNFKTGKYSVVKQ